MKNTVYIGITKNWMIEETVEAWYGTYCSNAMESRESANKKKANQRV